MEIDTFGNIEDTALDPSAQPQEGLPSPEGPPSQDGPPTWFLEYFGHLNATMD